MSVRYMIGTWCLLLAPFMLFGARSVQLPTLPRMELPNSEVVTNVALNVDYARLKNMTFSLELNASKSNSLSIAVVTEVGDSLKLEDADFEWGYDCGKWFRADTGTGIVDEWPETGTGRVARTLTIDSADFKPQWNQLRIVKRGGGVVCRADPKDANRPRRGGVDFWLSANSIRFCNQKKDFFGIIYVYPQRRTG